MARSEQTFQIRYDDRSWAGAWQVSGDTVHVTSAFGERSVPAGGRRYPRALAETMLKEIVQAHLGRQSDR
jgi:hypothetical protein